MSSSNQPQEGVAFQILPEGTTIWAQIILESRAASPSPTGQNWPQLWSLDVLMFSFPEASDGSVMPGTNEKPGRRVGLETSASPAVAFLADCLKGIRRDAEPAAVRFLFPAHDGYVTRNDFLEQRLECSECVAKAASFVSPLQAISSVAQCQVTPISLAEVIQKAIGGILVRTLIPKDVDTALKDLDAEMINKLSFPWVIPTPLQRKRVAWVQGRENINVSRRAYEAARALGITLVIMDNEGHWLQDKNWSHLREAFVPVDIEVDHGLSQRIVNAVRAYPHPIDGIVTISDFRLPAIAKACEILGLPTSSSEAYAIAKDKARTRMLEPDAHESFPLSNELELKTLLADRKGNALQFPLIVKPCHGYNSDCVSKVWNEAELREAVRRASARHASAADPNTSVVIEPYIDGPEVDINLVLLDEKVISCEISDDFPCDGDAEDANLDAGFQETKVVMPTALPESERAALRDSLRKSILRQGFRSGVFHCEARVRHSRVQYSNKDGVLDLQGKPEAPRHDICVYLHEINARPPGYLETAAISLTYGLDYFAIRLLLSLGSEENARLRALAQPFLKGAQFHLSITILPQTRAGVMKTEDAAESFLNGHPEIRRQVVDYETQMKKGAVLDGPAAASLWWIAYFSVVSRASRQECLELVDFIHKNFSYELQE